jgi:branched-subunit amino acid aminotransferase/4-amino-4-deoxychorismate lyase
LAGYDNALFYNRTGHVSEASIWNICFATEDRIVWPAAEVLPGITMLTLQAGLEALDVARETVDIPLTTTTTTTGPTPRSAKSHPSPA